MLTKPVPATVSTKSPVPAVALTGDRAVVVGNGLLTVKVNAGVDVPPPGAGLLTVIETVPAVAISDVSMVVRTWVESRSVTA